MGAEAQRSYRDGGMAGWEGAEEGLEERLVFSVGLWDEIIPLGHACVHVQHGSKLGSSLKLATCQPALWHPTSCPGPAYPTCLSLPDQP